MRDHVVYESRLELSRLIFADFDQAVQRILAQPFLLKAKVDGKVRKHIPDYFLAELSGLSRGDALFAQVGSGSCRVCL
jgi:hypothetical protein